MLHGPQGKTQNAEWIYRVIAHDEFEDLWGCLLVSEEEIWVCFLQAAGVGY